MSLENSTPIPPFSTWATAATNIQDAVDVAVAGDEVVVSNGVYQVGARVVYGMSNRVALTKAVVVRSLNGPAVTVIQGYQVPGTGNGPAAVRCAYLTNGAVLAGFTLTNGATRTLGPDSQLSGGGVGCESVSAVITNCVIAGNSAYLNGGGVYLGTLNNCVLAGNSAYLNGGGTYLGTLNNCTLTTNWASSYGGAAYDGELNNCVLAGNSASSGGGAYYSTLTDCTLIANSADFGGGACFSSLRSCVLDGNSASWGGGAYDVELFNCTLTGNTAGDGGGACYGSLNGCALSVNSAGRGGGAYDAELFNCTLTGNSAVTGGGAFYCTLLNCIVYYNVAAANDNYANANLTYCCTTPLPAAGSDNITAEPGLASLSHLSAGSPCRGAGGVGISRGLDIDGESWANPPSIGCDEYVAGAVGGSLSAGLVVAYTNVAVGFNLDFRAAISGRVNASAWNFGDGTVLSNRPYASHRWATNGDYVVVLTAYNEAHPAGVAATVTVHVVSRPVHYVALGNASPVPPYSSWATAATNIQDAVDAATAGALVLVGDGVYATGAREVYGMSNRVAVTKALVLQSVNGPAATVIQGNGVPGQTAVRCVYLTNGAVLAGFTLTNGATQRTANDSKQLFGGGVWCESVSAVVSNCTLVGNSTAYYGGGTCSGTLNNCTLGGNRAFCGGGAYGATLNNCALSTNTAHSGGGAYSGLLNRCTLTGNSATNLGGGAYESMLINCTLAGNSARLGGGAYEGTLNNTALVGNWATDVGGGAHSAKLKNCTLTGNSASSSGGGVSFSTLWNCIVYYNFAREGENYSSSTSLANCCATPLPWGEGNIALEPQLVDAWHLSASSPCRGAGSPAYASGLDIDGEPWGNPPSIGCDEYWSGSVTGSLTATIAAAYTNVAVKFSASFQGLINGPARVRVWDFGDGTLVTNQPFVSHAWAASGDYVVELRAYNDTYPAGVAASVTVHVSQPVHYVALGSASPEPPYSSWATAAANIQDAVDAATVPGALVLVSNGVYAVGARAIYGMSNRVAVTGPLLLQSLNGPEVTLIQGSQVPGTRNGAAAVRCAYLTNGAVLSGFTLTNGATQTTGDAVKQQSGGGVWCESANAQLTNCVLVGNWAANGGGGVCYGTLNHCTLTSNSAPDTSTGYGGGAYYSKLNHCTLSGNSAAAAGGGAYWSTLNNCLLAGNASAVGGGDRFGYLVNCSLIANTASSSGGGAAASTLWNCIVYANVAPSGTNYDSRSWLTNCCTTPLPANGTGNFTNAPRFIAQNNGNLRLQSDSPCINAGANSFVSTATDLDGNPRIVGGMVDVGAYEFQSPVSAISYWWLQQFGLPIAATTDYADPDLDGLSNYQEWLAGTAPTSAASVLRLLCPVASPAAVPAGTMIAWRSVTNRTYSLERGTNLGVLPAFSVLKSNIAGQAQTTTYLDTNVVGSGPFFYRVRVEQ